MALALDVPGGGLDPAIKADLRARMAIMSLDPHEADDAENALDLENM